MMDPYYTEGARVVTWTGAKGTVVMALPHPQGEGVSPLYFVACDMGDWYVGTEVYGEDD